MNSPIPWTECFSRLKRSLKLRFPRLTAAGSYVRRRKKRFLALGITVAHGVGALTSVQAVNRAYSHAARVKIDSLRPVAERILDAVEADLESEGAKRRAEITAADAVFGECGDCSEFDRRLARTRDFLAAERVAIRQEGASLAWLAAREFCSNPYLASA